MRVLFLLFLFVSSICVKAQPAKEETITFLKQDYFSQPFKFMTVYERTASGNYYIRYEHTAFSNVMLNGCTLSVNVASYRQEESTGDKKETGHKSETISIDFSRVQEIKTSGYNALLSGTSRRPFNIYNLVFVEIQLDGRKMEKILPFEVLEEGQQDWSNPKIIKAFQHLRKLCGAKDPISF